MYLPDKTEHIFYTKIKIEVEYNMYCIQHAEFVCILTVGVKYGIGLKHQILLVMFVKRNGDQWTGVCGQSSSFTFYTAYCDRMISILFYTYYWRFDWKIP